MSQLQYSRLCCLIHESLHPFTVICSLYFVLYYCFFPLSKTSQVKSTVSTSKEEEKSLLIILSQVLGKTKLWIGEFDSDSDNSDHSNPLIDISMCHSSASECIFTITNHLVFLLAVENGYIQHLAGNVLVSVSEFVAASVLSYHLPPYSYWDEFVQSLCFYFELIICKVISPSSDPPIRSKHLDFDSSNFKLDLHLVLNNAGLQSAGAIVLVLRTILKQQKHKDDDKIMQIYFHALGSCLQIIPRDMCNAIFYDKNCEISSRFCGYLVQLFCSAADSEDENPAIQEIFNIFPNILTWCLGKQGYNRNYTSVSQYIRYKILVLMIRLIYLVDLDCEVVVSWLNLINKYFQDLLFESLTKHETDQDDCLKDSPFLLNESSYRHLQRRVVFLYLRCCFSLIGLKERCKKQCSCGDVKSCSKKGFIALYEWIEKHIPANVFVNSKSNDDSCKSFVKSFLQLYMHEDDMLFEVLLQLTYTPFGYAQQISEDWISQVVKKDIFFLLLDIFDPVHLFRLFLSELHYDHQVLLNYLISKDTGASCAEYLLRCLRIICDKWNSFLGNESFHKRRKITNDLLSSDEIQMDHKNKKTCTQQFHDARDCLLLLKKSIGNLHQKDLFPYNPEVLLRRLTRFQELCLKR